MSSNSLEADNLDFVDRYSLGDALADRITVYSKFFERLSECDLFHLIAIQFETDVSPQVSNLYICVTFSNPYDP